MSTKGGKKLPSKILILCLLIFLDKLFSYFTHTHMKEIKAVSTSSNNHVRLAT